MSEIKPNRGFDYYYHRIRKQGFIWNRKRVLRFDRLLGFTMRRKSRKGLPVRLKTPSDQPIQPREGWSMDFMSDSLLTDGSFRILNIIDDYNRQALCTTSDFSNANDSCSESFKTNHRSLWKTFRDKSR